MRRKQAGLTLVELMVTLVVAAILLGVGLPLFTGILGSNRATTQANSLLSSMKLARSESVKRATDAYVCASVNELPDPDLACATAGPDWTNGWIAHTDNNIADGLDPALVLRAWDGLADTATVVFATPGAVQVQFDADGESVGGPFSFELDDSAATGGANGVAERCVSIELVGLVRTSRGGCP